MNLAKLIESVEWVSGTQYFGNAAYIRRDDGRIFWIGDGIEQVDGIPEDLEDGSRYLAVPRKQDLGLGKPLALRFAEECLSSDLGEVRHIFSRRGAYQRFKSLLEHRHRLDDWFEYEARQTEEAVCRWAQEHGFDPCGPENNAADA